MIQAAGNELDEDELAKYQVLSDQLGGRTALRLMHTAQDIRLGRNRLPLPKRGSFPEALNYHLKDSAAREQLRFGFGKAGTLPSDAAERLAEAIYDPAANKTELAAAFGGGGTFAPALASQGGSIIKDSAMKGYNDIISNISTQIGTRTDKNYWDGRIESTKLLWDIWILGIKDRMDQRTKDSEVLKISVEPNAPNRWNWSNIGADFTALSDAIKLATGAQITTLPANAHFLHTERCYTKLKLYLPNAIDPGVAPIHWGLHYIINAPNDDAFLRALQTLKERFPLTASRMYPVAREAAGGGRAGFDYNLVLILRTWRNKFDNLSIAFTSKYGPFDAIYRATPSCTRRYWRNTSTLPPAELATMIDMEIQAQFGDQIAVPLSQIGFYHIGSGFICTQTILDSLGAAKGTITPFQNGQNPNTSEDWLTMLYCKNTLAKWFWAKKIALEKVSKDRVQKYLDQDKKDLNQIYYFLGAKPVLK